jgi:uncharacterized membrane protein YgcG
LLHARSWQHEDVDALREGGLDALRSDAYVVNGAVTQHNPWAATGTDAMWRYREVQAAKRADREAVAAVAAAAGAGSSSEGGSGGSSSSVGGGGGCSSSSTR